MIMFVQSINRCSHFGFLSLRLKFNQTTGEVYEPPNNGTFVLCDFIFRFGYIASWETFLLTNFYNFVLEGYQTCMHA